MVQKQDTSTLEVQRRHELKALCFVQRAVFEARCAHRLAENQAYKEGTVPSNQFEVMVLEKQVIAPLFDVENQLRTKMRMQPL